MRRLAKLVLAAPAAEHERRQLSEFDPAEHEGQRHRDADQDQRHSDWHTVIHRVEIQILRP
jgi:hypothetical protein